MATWQADYYGGEEEPQPGDLAGGAYISSSRIILMSIVSLGIYWFYWMYRTWLQYRDHTAAAAADTGQIHYPFWHGLTQLVPIYGFFRFHAHIRRYKELMQGRGVPDTLNLDVLTVIVVISTIVGFSAGGLTGRDAVGLAVRLIAFVIQLATVAVSVGVMCRAQSNINAYWADVDRQLLRSARFGKGEIVCIILGVLLWILTWGGIIWPS